MTCIVGLVDQGKVWIGGDSSIAPNGWEIRANKNQKVFRRGEFVIGFTTSWRMGQLLQFQLNVTPQDDDQSDLEYMVCVFAEAVRKCLSSGGYTTIESNRELAGEFLIAYRGHLYAMYSDFQVSEKIDGLDALGCGRDYALGALFAGADFPAEMRIKQALMAAAYFSGGVCEPFEVIFA